MDFFKSYLPHEDLKFISDAMAASESIDPYSKGRFIYQIEERIKCYEPLARLANVVFIPDGKRSFSPIDTSLAKSILPILWEIRDELIGNDYTCTIKNADDMQPGDAVSPTLLETLLAQNKISHQISFDFGMGKIEDAYNKTQTLLNDCQQTNDLFMKVWSYGMLGNCCIALGRLTHALQHLRQAEWLAKGLSSEAKEQIIPIIRSALGLAFRDLGMTDNAINYLEDSLCKFIRQGNWAYIISTQLDLAYAYMHKDLDRKAEFQIINAVRNFNRYMQKDVQVRSQIYMISCFFSLKQVLMTNQFDTSALQEILLPMKRYLGLRLPAYYSLFESWDRLVGTTYKSFGRYLRKIWLRSISSQDYPSHIAAHTFMGLYFKKVKKDSKKASYMYKKAITIIERTRGNTAKISQRRTFLGQNLKVYDLLIESQIKDGCLEEAFITVEQARSRALFELIGGMPSFDSSQTGTKYESFYESLEQFKKHLLKNTIEGNTEDIEEKIREIMDSAFAKRDGSQSPKVDMDLLKAGFNPKEAILEFYVLQSNILIFLILDGGLYDIFVVESFGSEELLKYISTFWISPYKDFIRRVKLKLVDSAYKTFSKKIQVCLSGISSKVLNAKGERHRRSLKESIMTDHKLAFKKFILIPHGDLWMLPLHCLPVDMTTERAFIDTQTFDGEFPTITYAHSCKILQRCRQIAPPISNQLIAVMHPDMHSSIANIKKGFPSVTILKEKKELTIANILEELCVSPLDNLKS